MSVYFPLTDMAPTKKISGDVGDVEGISLGGYTALVAEDEPDLLLIVADMLERLGMQVIQARNGNEALSKQDEFDGVIDLLLTDVVMPELDGARMAEMFCALRPSCGVIFMSGYPGGASQVNASLPEGARLIAKPLEYEALAKIIYQTLSGHDGVDDGGAVNAPHWQSFQHKTKAG
mgnify:CR=1 FL=1